MNIQRIGQKNLTVHHNGPNAVVYSYSTPVIVIFNNECYVTSQKYSVTTTKHINHYFNRINCVNINHRNLVEQSRINELARKAL